MIRIVVVFVSALMFSGCGGEKSGSRSASNDPPVIDAQSRRMLEMVTTAQIAGEYAAAGVVLDSLDVRLPESAPVQFLRGVQFESTGFRDAARDAYARSAELDPSFPGAWHNLGRLHAQDRSYRKALEAFQKAAGLQPTAGALHGVGNAYFELGKTDSAQVALREALKLDPQNVASRLALASVLEKMGETDSIAAVLRPCAAAAFDSECAKEFAVDLVRQGSTSQALDSLDHIVDVRPWDKEVYYTLAQALAAEGQTVEADAARKRFAEIDEVDREIFRLQERIDLNPESLRERFELADRYRSIGRLIDAAQSLTVALALAPNNLNIRSNIGLLLLSSDQPKAAAEQFRLILRIDSTFTGAMENLRRADAMLNR